MALFHPSCWIIPRVATSPFPLPTKFANFISVAFEPSDTSLHVFFHLQKRRAARNGVRFSRPLKNMGSLVVDLFSLRERIHTLGTEQTQSVPRNPRADASSSTGRRGFFSNQLSTRHGCTQEDFSRLAAVFAGAL